METIASARNTTSVFGVLRQRKRGRERTTTTPITTVSTPTSTK
ncbi:MAG: hypothetical protein ACTHJI_00765 [Leifsonia sp.]